MLVLSSDTWPSQARIVLISTPACNKCVAIGALPRTWCRRRGGGVALAGFLEKLGANLTIYEQAKAFRRVGAGIQMGPNDMHVLRALGLEPMLRRFAFYPQAWTHRVWNTGAHLADLTFGEAAEGQWGAPYLLMHRGDLHAALFSVVPEARIAFEKKLVGLDTKHDSVTLRFALAAGSRPMP